jgi:hypothetical protein
MIGRQPLEMAGIANPALIFAVSVGLADTLLEPLGKQGGGFNLFGPGSKGKSTSLGIACSCLGMPDKYWRKRDATKNGLGAHYAADSDTFMALDELGEADGKVVGSTMHAITDGVGRARANQSCGAQVLSAGGFYFCLQVKYSWKIKCLKPTLNLGRVWGFVWPTFPSIGAVACSILWLTRRAVGDRLMISGIGPVPIMITLDQHLLTS